MIEIRNSEHLQRWLLESGHLARLWDRPRFHFDSQEFDCEVAGVRAQYPHFSAAEAEARAALRLLGKEEARARTQPPTAAEALTQLSPPARHPALERLLFVIVLLLAIIAVLLAAPRAHGQTLHHDNAGPTLADAGYRSNWFPAVAASPASDGYGAGPVPYGAVQGGQPGGVILQFANGGSVLATRPAGIVQLNCTGSGITCSWANGSGSTPPTFTLNASGGSGSGCIPPGTTANALLFDAGSGTCSDIADFTFASHTVTAGSSGKMDLSAASLVKFRIGAGLTTSVNGDCGYDSTANRWHCWQGGADKFLIAASNVGNSGQPCLSNADGSCTFADPIVSGPDARGAAQSKNPVAGLAGIDYGSGCSGGPCVQEAKVDSSGNLYIGNFPATQSVSGTVTATQGNAGSNAQGWWVEIGDTSHGPAAVKAASTAAVAADPALVVAVSPNNSVAVTGTFWQSTQPVSCASGATCPVNATLQASAGTDIGKLDANQSVNLTQIAGTALATPNPCLTTAPTALAINEATSSLTTIISGASSKHTYICSIALITAAAQNINLVAGTGTNCGTTVHVGFFGGTTAATGLNLAANGGFTLGNGQAVVAGGTDTAADNICYTSSGNSQVSGVLTYVQQ